MSSFKYGATLLAVLATASAAANESPYYYGGLCGSQGSWTQQALLRTSELKSFIKRVKDDPNCKALPETLQATFSGLEAQVKTLQNSAPQAGLSNIPKEISALRNFMKAEPQYRQEITQIISQKLVQQSVSQSQSPLLTVSNDQMETADGLVSLKERSSRTFSQSLHLLDQAVDALPQLEQCLIEPSVMGQFLASTIQLVGAFASTSNDPTGSQIARTVSKLSNYTREKNFANSLATLERNQLMASLACLLEVTSESYCSARDGKIIFDEMQANLELIKGDKGNLKLRTRKIETNGSVSDHPLEGYYVLTQNLPIITAWLQTIQIGVEPRMQTDAQQKNKIHDEMATYMKAVNDLLGAYNASVLTMQTQTEDEKRNEVLSLVTKLSEMMIGPQGFGKTDSKNFFTLTDQPMHIPFKLIGVETPPEVLGQTGGFMQPWDQYLQAKYKTMPAFKNPDTLTTTVHSNMRALIQKAEVSAIKYYTTWFVFDKIAIINKSFVGHLYNVKESLKEIDAYLFKLTDRVRRLSSDQSIVPAIQDTRIRIRKVLDQYKGLEAAGLRAGVELSPNDGTLALAEQFVNEVSIQFYTMLAKSGWLANRLGDFVQYDYNLMQRSGFNMSPYVNEIYLATGRSMVENILEMTSGNPAAVNQDLAMALRLNKGNLEALETALGSSYVNQIAYLTHITKGYKSMNGMSLEIIKHPERSRWKTDPIPGQPNNVVLRNLKALWNNAVPSWGEMTAPIVGPSRVKLSPDDEFGSAARLRDQFCAQTLAFNDLRPFWYLCVESTLESPFKNSILVGDASAKSLSLSYKEKAWEEYGDTSEKKALNHSKRICGFRDYSRKNLVLYLLQGQTRQ